MTSELKLNVWVEISWWAKGMIKLYQWWLWIRPVEPTIENCRRFIDWLFKTGGLKVRNGGS